MRRMSGAGPVPLRELAEFRYQLRRFLQFSEDVATSVGLPPQQHQMMLQIAGAPVGAATTIAYLAERLLLKHNTVVELANRCEDAGLVGRRGSVEDRRLVILDLTVEGRHLLQKLSLQHAQELGERGPQLMKALQALEGRG